MLAAFIASAAGSGFDGPHEASATSAAAARIIRMLVLLLLLGRRRRRLRFLPIDPAMHPRLKHRQRQRAAAQHLVVEGWIAELVAQRRLRLITQLLKLDHPDLVGRGLARRRKVAAHFGPDGLLW